MSSLSDQSKPVSSRLQELQRTGLLDTPAEEVFDHFTALASQILGTPIALISLVDEDRQFFKSQVGLPQPWATTRQTPLSHSFCQHVVATQEPLIIADARQNPLVSNNPAIDELGVIAYAGIPLLTLQGEAIGSFCVIDSQPRQWSEHEVSVLRGLAQAVMTEIALRQSARELQRAARRVEGILESITDAFFQLDASWCFAYVNDQALRIMDRSREQLLGSNLWHAFPEIVGSNFERQYRLAIETGEAVSFEELFAPLDRWIEVHAYPGEEGLAVYFQNITQRKKNEERLRLLESSVVYANDAVLITEAGLIDEPGPRILYVNDAFTRMTGYALSEVIGRSPRFLQGPQTSRAHLDQIRAALENCQATSVELLNYHKDGSTFWTEMSLVPVADENGHFTHWISIQRDVGERKHAEDAILSAKNEAERANLAKSEFLSRMSHELRTPLNAILGFGQLLEMDDLSEEQHQGVEQIIKGGRHLLGLINEVLDIARIEAEQDALDIGPISVAETLAGALQMIRPLATARRIELRENWSANGDFVLADRRRLHQVLLNLLSNAVKYNCEGGVVTLSSDSAAGRLRIAVTDTGEGLAPEKIGQLFMPFERLGAENSGIEGSGLGLALSKRLAEAMGGSIGVQSEVGQGSTFTLELALAPAPITSVESAALEIAAPAPVKARETRSVVLYIEDNLTNLSLVQKVLQRRSEIKLLAAARGQIGLELAQRYSPNLILLDCHLPDLSGEEVLRHLRADPQTSAIPVIVVSADATPMQIKQMRAAGALDYLTKPLDVRQFLMALDAHLPTSATPTGGEERSQTTA